MKILKIYIFTVLIIFFRSISAYGESSAKIAVVDVESILENSSAIGSIRKSINELTKTIEDEITEQEKEYKKRQQELLELQKTLNQHQNLLFCSKSCFFQRSKARPPPYLES